MKRVTFVVNPISGTTEKKETIKLVEEAVAKRGDAWKIIETKYAGHATEIAKDEVSKGTDVVVAIGGDGTVNEIGKALVHTDTALAIIPAGSGNGLARDLEIPMSPKGALEVIEEMNKEIIDYGKINDTCFFCTCGVGFDAFVSLKFAESGKRGLLTYLEKTLQESLRYEPETYELEAEGSTTKHKAFLIACGNAAQYGNNAYIAPKAMITDGQMDVTIIEPFTFLDVPALAFQLFNRTINTNSRIKTMRCRTLRITRKGEGVVHFDGDPVMMGEELFIEIIPRGLHVILPKKRANEIRSTGKEKQAEADPKEESAEFKDVLGYFNRHIIDRNKAIFKKLTKKE